MKRRFSRIMKDCSIVLSFVLFIGVVGFSAKNELGFLLGSVKQTSITEEMMVPLGDVPSIEMLTVIEPDPVPLANAGVIVHTALPQSSPVTTPAYPKHLTIPAIGIDQSITEYTNDMVAQRGGINPEGWFTVAWWSGGGFPNASPNNSPVLTTFLYGHSTNVPTNKIVFDDIGALAIGDNITIETSQGNHTYAVEEVFTVPKSEAMSDPRITKNTAGRLLLTSCWGEPPNIGATATHNIVVIAQQIPTPPPK